LVARARFIILGLSVAGIAIAIAAWFLLETSSEVASAQEILANAQDKHDAVGTYKFTIKAWQTPQVKGDPAKYETSTEGVVVRNKGMHITVRGNDSYNESLLLDDGQYSRHTPDGSWKQHQGSFDTSQMTTLDSTQHRQFVDGTGFAVGGTETLNGIAVRKITGRLDLQQRARQIWGDSNDQASLLQAGSEEPRQQMVAGREDFVGWVGVEDGLLHAFEVSGAYPAMGELLAFEFWYRMEFSEFDEPLELPSVK